MTGQIIAEVLAWAPLTAFVIVMLVAYYMTRPYVRGTAAHSGKTFACAHCGRRGKHEHMVPVKHEGAVVWYCGRCAQTAH
jgi:membrane protein implicated in regulation of membrane protease activity